MMKPVVIYVDVEGTLVNTIGNRQVPIEAVIQHIRDLYEHGAELYCWSSAGASFAENVANSIGLVECFKAFLPKPNVMIDDIAITDWRQLLQIHPRHCVSKSLYDYEDAL